jgi:hypothetical protein
MTAHVCNFNIAWPIGHPLPEERAEKLTGPEVGAEVTYHRVRRHGEGFPVVWIEEVDDLPATVLTRSYVWSPGECRHKGGYRRYDLSVIEVHEASRNYTVVVDHKDLS